MDTVDQAWRHIALLAGAELALARLTSAPVPLWEAVVSVALLGAVGIVPWRYLPSDERPAVRLAQGALGWLPLVWVATGIALPALLLAPFGASSAFWGFVAAATLASGVAEALRGRPIPPLPHLFALLVASTRLAEPLALPGDSGVGMAVAAWVICFGAAIRPQNAPLAAGSLLAIGIAPIPVDWSRVDQPGRDVVILTVDALRADDGAEMASYRRLAERGRRFTNAVAPAPWTLPSLATLHTGLRVDTHRAGLHDGSFAALSGRTLAERLGQAGYRTHAITAENGFISRTYGLHRGFDVFDHPRERHAHPLPRGKTGRRQGRPVVARVARRLLFSPPRPRTAPDLVRRARAALTQPGPTFLWVHFMDVHLPWRHSAFPSATRLELRDHPDHDAVRAAYRDEVSRLDAVLDRFIADLPADALVVLTTDHGEAFWEQGVFEHGVNDPAVRRIPLVIGGLTPGDPEGSKVGLRDVAPTVLSVLGLPTTGLEGTDLRNPPPGRDYPEGPALYGQPIPPSPALRALGYQ